MTYSLQTIVDTSNHFLVQNDLDNGENVDIAGYVWEKSTIDQPSRPGVRYLVSRDVDADDAGAAHKQFFEDLHVITDGLAYYFSQPFSVEFWNFIIMKEADSNAYLSAYRLIPATSLRDAVISSNLSNLLDDLRNNTSFQNAVRQYNILAKVDGVESDVATSQLHICTLVEFLADKEQVEACEICGRGSYQRSRRTDMKSMLGSQLYAKLFGGRDILRNRLAHGNLHGAEYLPANEVDEAIVKISKRMAEKYGHANKVTSSTSDPIRSTYRWYGCVAAVEHNGNNLDFFLKALISDRIESDGNITQDW